jgi:uncharacterized protein (DUF1330 family)
MESRLRAAIVRRRLLALTSCLWLAGGAQASNEPVAAPEAAAPKKGYLLFRSRYDDPQALRPYGRAVVEVAAKFGGRFIVLADAPEAVEGTPDTRRVVIMEFPSLAAARAFWISPEYAEVKKLREGLAGEIDAILFEGR